MTLPTSGGLTIFQICDEFGIPHNSIFPSAFYGLGGAPSSGTLIIPDHFYGRSATVYVSLSASGGPGTYTVTAHVTGGNGNYTYEWDVADNNSTATIQSNGSSATVQRNGPSSDAMTVSVVVDDTAGHEGTSSISL